MRSLAIDFGERRIGLAISDPAGAFALPLATLARANDADAVRDIAAIAAREEVDELIVGEPRNLDGTLGPAAERCRRFAERLGAATGLPIAMTDETLTTVEATARLRAAGVDPRRHPERLDAAAAQVLLEEVLARRARGSRGAG